MLQEFTCTKIYNWYIEHWIICYENEEWEESREIVLKKPVDVGLGPSIETE